MAQTRGDYTPAVVFRKGNIFVQCERQNAWIPRLARLSATATCRTEYSDCSLSCADVGADEKPSSCRTHAKQETALPMAIFVPKTRIQRIGAGGMGGKGCASSRLFDGFPDGQENLCC
jgi:hypothetical protein